MSNNVIVYPEYFKIVYRNPKTALWGFPRTEVFYNPNAKAIKNINENEKEYGLTKQAIAIKLFRQFGGLFGWYLVDMKHDKMYHCGDEKAEVDKKIKELLT